MSVTEVPSADPILPTINGKARVGDRQVVSSQTIVFNGNDDLEIFPIGDDYKIWLQFIFVEGEEKAHWISIQAIPKHTESDFEEHLLRLHLEPQSLCNLQAII